jgi:hypothetical protein
MDKTSENTGPYKNASPSKDPKNTCNLGTYPSPKTQEQPVA